MDESPEIAGYLYKRRGGLGKWSLNNWQSRLVTISREGMLCYFENENPETMLTESKARGKLDLKNVPYEFATDVPAEGSPTPFVMQISPYNDSEKWKLCASSKEEQNKWTVVFNRYANDHAARAKVSATTGANYTSDGEDDTSRAPRRNTLGKSVSMGAVLGSGTDAISALRSPHPATPSASTSTATGATSTPTTANTGIATTTNRPFVATDTSKAQQPASIAPTTTAPTATHTAAVSSSSAATTTSSAVKNAAVNTRGSSVAVHAPATTAPKPKHSKKRLKTGSTKGFINPDVTETVSAMIILNICIYLAVPNIVVPGSLRSVVWLLFANAIVLHTLNLRAKRVDDMEQKCETLKQALEDANAGTVVASSSHVVGMTGTISVGGMSTEVSATAGVTTVATVATAGEVTGVDGIRLPRAGTKLTVN